MNGTRARKGSILVNTNWEDIAGKPLQFPPVAHQHELGDISGLQLALNNKADADHNHDGAYEPKNQNIQEHIANTDNPHSVNKSDVGLSNVDNTSDANKPVSSAQQIALNAKVDKVTGKDLSTEDYTTTEKNKLAGIDANANNYSHPTSHLPAIIQQDANNRFVTDAEKQSWNNKIDAIVGKGLSTEDYTTTEKNKLAGIDANANNYQHPGSHLPTIIQQDASNRFVTDAEKQSWNSKAAGSHNHDTVYLGKTAKAADSDKLDGLNSSDFARYYGRVVSDLNSYALSPSGFYGISGSPSNSPGGTYHSMINAKNSDLAFNF